MREVRSGPLRKNAFGVFVDEEGNSWADLDCLQEHFDVPDGATVVEFVLTPRPLDESLRLTLAGNSVGDNELYVDGHDHDGYDGWVSMCRAFTMWFASGLTLLGQSTPRLDMCYVTVEYESTPNRGMRELAARAEGVLEDVELAEHAVERAAAAARDLIDEVNARYTYYEE